LHPWIVQQSLHGDSLAEADLVQFLDCAHGRRDRQNLATRFPQSAEQLSQRGRFAGAGCTPQVHELVARAENELRRMLLLRPQPIRRHELSVAAEPFPSTNALIHAGDRLPFPSEAHRGCHLTTVPKNGTR
jgi:hypothetical protein